MYSRFKKNFYKDHVRKCDTRVAVIISDALRYEVGQEILEKLPLGKVADKEIQSIRNPIVITALFELRKLVNEIIDDYGTIDHVKVEMARDLKISKSQRLS